VQRLKLSGRTLRFLTKVNGLRLARTCLAFRRAAVEHGRLFPGRVDRFVGLDPDRVRLLAGQFEQRAEHAGVRALALLQALKMALKMCAISPRKARAICGGCVEANSSITGR
jgi:hypothetical protein